MNRAIQFVGVVWLGAAGLCAAQQKPPKNPPPPKPAPMPAAKAPGPANNKNGGNNGNNGGVPKGGPKMANPDNPFDRLLKMPPEQRELAIEKLPAKQQENLRKRFSDFDAKPQAEKERELTKLNELWSLPPDKHELVADQIKAFNALPEDRRVAVQRAYRNLSAMTPEQRAQRLARPEFKSRFTPQELQILSVLPELWPVPAKDK